MRPLFRVAALSTTLGASLFALAPASTANAGAVNGPEAASPFRCAQEGICTQEAEEASLIGACRRNDQELRFDALYRPSGEATPADGNQFCVTLVTMEGEIVGGLEEAGANCKDTASKLGTASDSAEAIEGALSQATVGCLQHVLFAQPLVPHPAAWHAIQSAASQALNAHDKAKSQQTEELSDGQKDHLGDVDNESASQSPDEGA